MSSTQPRDLQGQKALVTGATSGIGRAIALQLAQDGAEVIVHGRDVERGIKTVETIVAAGGKARFIAADLSNPTELQHLVEEVGADHFAARVKELPAHYQGFTAANH